MNRGKAMHKTIELRPATRKDYDFLYYVKKTTLKPYIEEIWGWDEDIQQAFFANSFDTKTHQVIFYKGIAIGLLETFINDHKIDVIELELLPEYQGKQIGSSILKDILKTANQNNMKVGIGCFKQNARAKKLYEKLGFHQIKETATHYILEYNF